MESISKIKLKNQAGAITMLKGYVKVASDSEAYYKCGATDNFDVGQSGMIDLNDHDPPCQSHRRIYSFRSFVGP